MASLRFTFDGDRRLGTNCGEKGRPLFYPYLRYPQYQAEGRCNSLYEQTSSPKADPPGHKGPDDMSPEQNRKIKEQEIQPLVIIDEASGNKAEKTGQGDFKKETGDNAAQQQQETEKDKITVNASEKFIKNMVVAETGLNNLKVQVDIAKNLFDELIYKLDSGMQILDIIKRNEERRIIGHQAQVASEKTTKDTVDELLELLQTPVIQNILRQFIMGWITQNSKREV